MLPAFFIGGTMTKKFKPMLAASELPDITKLEYPLYVTPKFDGIRALVRGGKLVSRSLKPHKNKFILSELDGLVDGFDGELDIKGAEFNELSGAIRREDGEPDFIYRVFDFHKYPKDKYLARCAEGEKQVALAANARVVFVVPTRVESAEELEAFYEQCLRQGYEGCIIRTGDGPYKHGRSTLRQGWMLKYKPFEDDEAEIIGFEEMMHNDNEAVTNELGHTERSSHKENLRPAGMLGKFLLRRKDGLEFSCGSGFTKEQRIDFWNRRDELLGELVKYKFMAVGIKDKPRHPVFIGFRDRDDMGE